MVIPQIDAARELEAALRLLAARWTLALPTAIASLVVAAIIFFVIGAVVVTAIGAAVLGHSAAAVAALGAGAMTLAASLVAIVAISVIAQMMVMAAAYDAWEGHEPNFRDAFARVVRRLPAIVVAFFVVFLMYLIPLVLSVVLIGIPLLFVLSYFLMYVRPAILIGGEDGISAIATSFRMAYAHAGPSLAAFGAIIGAFIVGRMVDAMTLHIPGLGLITAFAVGGATAAFIALVEVRFYALLRERVMLPPA